MDNSETASDTWTTLDVAGHSCRWFEPSRLNPHSFTVIYLHAAGCEDPAEYPAFAAEFARHGLRAIAPQSGPSWWSDRLCAEFDPHVTAEQYLLDHVLPIVAARCNQSSPRVALLGISMGGQGALRLAYKYPDTFPVAAGISSAIDFHLWLGAPREQPELKAQLTPLYRDMEDARQDTATLHIHPLNWPRHQFFCCDPSDHWHEGADRLRMKLQSIGVPYECDLETEAGGHSWEYFSTMLPRCMDFIAERLEQDRRRIV
ncbi:MAG: alpha/beta hydrolase-fold protein [Aeoliella sp.]